MMKVIAHYKKKKKKRCYQIYHFNSTKAEIKKEGRGPVPWTGCVGKLHCNLPYHEQGLCEPVPSLWSWSRDLQGEEERLYQEVKDESKYHFPNRHLKAKKSTMNRIISYGNSSTSLRAKYLNQPNLLMPEIVRISINLHLKMLK